jgi:hypothetical protein
MTYINQQEEIIKDHENVLNIGNMETVSKVKIKLIQGMIPIEHPIN